jgi:hypothetical protein
VLCPDRSVESSFVFIYYYYESKTAKNADIALYKNPYFDSLDPSGHRVILKPSILSIPADTRYTKTCMRFSRSQRTSRYTKTWKCDSRVPADIALYRNHLILAIGGHRVILNLYAILSIPGDIALFVYLFTTLLLLLLRPTHRTTPHYTILYHAEARAPPPP